VDRYVANESMLDWALHPRFAGVMAKVLIPGAANPSLNVNRVRLDPECEIPLHVHEASSETFYVLSGTGVCTIGDEEIDFEPGYGFYAAPGFPHGVRNIGLEPIELIAIFAPPTA
jgi:mannose-6-phosphate isomerase-like protein (cupin superfamily)